MTKIYFGEPKIVNSDIIVPVLVDSEFDYVNAFDIKIKTSQELIFRDWSSAGSVVNFWLEKPYIQNDILQFSGLSIGGYSGRNGLILDLIFELENKSSTTVDKIFLEALPSSKVFLNDGFGTEAKLTTEKKFFKVELLKKEEAIVDEYPPEDFKIYLYKDRQILEGKYHIIFQASDKQSGIAYYEIAENQSFFKPNVKSLIFGKSNSPYILKDQTLRSYVFVKAVDKFGNEKISFLPPQNYFYWYEVFFVSIIILLGIVFLSLINKFISKKLKVKRK